MRKRGKVAVTIANDLLAAVERERKKTGESRSAVFERALVAYLAGQHRAAEARRYVEGYQRAPERAAEVRVALAASIPGLGEEPWDAQR